MGKKQTVSRAERLQLPEAATAPVEGEVEKKRCKQSNCVVYLGHLPYGFTEAQLKTYFEQYGEVVSVKLARSRRTARSKGYGFVRFQYPEVAEIVANTMNGYFLLGKVLEAHTLKTGDKNPFLYASSKQYKFIDWRRKYRLIKNRQRTQEEMAKDVQSLLLKEKQKRERLTKAGIVYQFPGFSALV